MNATATPPAPADAPGRSCPLHYQYGPDVFRTPPPADLADLEVLYLVGGLYGNALALQAVLRAFEAETGRKRLVFNGDFHWFDVDPATFAQVQRQVLAHTALRGNVETELAQPDLAADNGCGCAYPNWVDDGVVERSNRILARLRQATTPAQCEALAALPMWSTASVGGCTVGVVHGDAQSLAGWGFAQEHLRDSTQRAQVRRWFERAGVDAFACSHTCLPVFQRVARPHAARPGWIFNNGAAGMPNFQGDAAGLLTRIALRPYTAGPSRATVVHGDVHVDAVAITFDAAQAERDFLAQWPPGSDAHASYHARIAAGPAYHPHHVIRLED